MHSVFDRLESSRHLQFCDYRYRGENFAYKTGIIFFCLDFNGSLMSSNLTYWLNIETIFNDLNKKDNF